MWVASALPPVKVVLMCVCLVRFTARFCLMASDILILIVTWFKTFTIKRDAHRHGIRTPLATLLLHDGTTYFMVLLCLSILDIIGQIKNAFIYSSAFILPLSSIMMTHFLLNLRQLNQATNDDAIGSHPSFVRSSGIGHVVSRASLGFTPFVDNLGEFLDHDRESSIAIDPDLYWEANDSDDPTATDEECRKESALDEAGMHVTLMLNRAAQPFVGGDGAWETNMECREAAAVVQGGPV